MKDNYTKFCEGNWNHMENNGSGIKTIIPIEYITTEVSYLFEFNNRTTALTLQLSNVLKDFFASDDEGKKSNITFLPQHNLDCLHTVNANIF